MGLDQFISFIVAVTLAEMMLATRLSVRTAEVFRAIGDRKLSIRVGLANYVAVPSAAVILLLAEPDPPVAAGMALRWRRSKFPIAAHVVAKRRRGNASHSRFVQARYEGAPNEPAGRQEEQA
jgi:hypothetical protein